MDWLRSCYRSEWHLFRDAPGATTRGRYYRCAPDTPFFPGSHNLGSRVWHDSNWQTVVQLGEDLEVKQAWDNGLPPAALPLAQLVGELACVANGESIDDALQPDQTDDGFPLACYIPPVPLDPFWHHAATIMSCDVQKFYARMIGLIYTGDAGPAEEYSRRFFGPGSVAKFHAGTKTLPALMTVITPTFAAAIVSGTADFQQFALQAFYALRGPQSYGQFSTNPQWYACSDWIHSHLAADGASGNAPILFAGHSYGAAASLVLAARYRFADANRPIRWITYGSPKPGDSRLQSLLRQTQGLALANTDDYVTVLPPDGIVLNPVYVILGVPALLFWIEWEYPPNVTLIDEDGNLHPNDAPALDTLALLGFAVDVLASISLNAFPTHPIERYIEKIAMRCPGDFFPASGQLGLSGIAPRSKGALGLSALRIAKTSLGLVGHQVAGGQLGLGFEGIPGQLGLGAAFEVAGGQLGLGFEGIAGQLGLVGHQVAGGQLGLGFEGIPGQLGLGSSAQIAGGQLGMGIAFNVEVDQLGLGSSAQIAGGQLSMGIAFNVEVDQLGLGGYQLLVAGRIGLGFEGILGQVGLAGHQVAGGQLGLGIAFNVEVDQLGLGSSAQIAGGQLGMGIAFNVEVDQLGLVGHQVAGGQLGLGFEGIPGQLGLGAAFEVAGGQLGLGAAFEVAGGQLGLGFEGLEGQLGLVGHQVAGGQLGLGGSMVARGLVDLWGCKVQYSAVGFQGEPVAVAVAGWWKFDDGSGTSFIDSSGHGHTGTLASANWAVDAPASTGNTNCAKFSGSTNGGSIPYSTDWALPTTGNFSIGAWIKLDSVAFSGYQVIALHDDLAGANNWHWAIHDGTKIYFQRNQSPTNTVIFDYTASPAANTWFQVVITRTGNTWALYFNGALATTTTNSIALPSNTTPMGVAAFTSFNIQNLAGRLSDYRIYHTSLTATQISFWYATGVT